MAYIKPKIMTSLIIKKQVVRVEKLIGERNKFKDVAFKRQRILNESKRFEQQEKKVEDRPNEKERQVSNKIPVPKLGFLDVIKNFLFNILLGAFTIKLLPHLPKLKGVLVGAMKFSEFILEFSGSILNAFVTFIDKVYQIVDFGKQQAKLLGGDKGLQSYNKVLDLANKVMNYMFIAGMLFSDLAESDARGGAAQQAVDAVKDRVVQQGAQRAAQQGALRAAGQFGARAAAGTVAGVGLLSSALGEGAFQLRKFTTKIQKDANEAYNEAQKDKNPFMRFIKTGFYSAFVRPGMMFTNFLLNGLGTLLDVVGAPFRYAVELINYGIMMLTGDAEGMRKQRENLGKFDARIREQIRETVNTLSFGTLAKEKGSFGSLFGSDATKAMGYAQGGAISRGGVYTDAITRTVGKKVKAKRIITVPTAPLQPGSDVGGMLPYEGDKTSKIETFYPNPSDPGTVNSFKYLKKVYNISGSTKFLHPILQISIKSLVGDKPPEGDFKAVGVGLNNFLNDILDTTKVPGKDTAISDEIGSIDISNIATSMAKDSITNPINLILSNLIKQLALKKSSPTGQKSKQQQGGGGASQNPLAQFGGQAQFIIGDSIAHGFAKRSGNGTDSDDTMVGRGAAAVLAILKAKGDSLRGALIDLSTGIANSTGDWTSVEEQLSYLKSIGARVRILGVANEFSKAKDGINEKLAQLASKYGFYFYGGYAGGKDKLHGTDEDYTNLKRKQESDTKQLKPESTELGKGYESGGVKIAGELGRYIYQKLRSPEQFLAVTEHPEFGGVKEKHADGSYHYSNRAIDIGAYTKEQGPILKVISDFNRMKNVKPVELLHGKNDSEHSDHVHVAYKDGGPVNKTDYALTHKGEYVVDADSVKLFGINFYDIINQVETASQRKKASESLVSILSQYTEDGFPETDDDYTYYAPESSPPTVIPPTVISISSGSSGSGGGGEDPSQDSLYM